MSGPDFTPTEYIIRLAYRHTSLQNTTPAPTTEELDAEFDRAIAKIKADAWAEGYESGLVDEAHDARGIGDHDYAENPYRS